MNSDQDSAHIGEEVKRYDYDRWLCSLFTDAEKRDALFALISFNIELARIRETVSEPMLGDIRLQWWREAMKGMEEGMARRHPVVEALHLAHHQAPLDFNMMQAMIDVRVKDLDPTPMETDADLIAYADGTGGALQQMIARTLGAAAGSPADEAAKYAGRAFALSGILRAIPFHLQHDLVLIPISRLEDVGTSRNTIFQEEHRASFFGIIKALTELIRDQLKEGRKIAKDAGKEARSARLLNSLTGLYLKRLQKNGYDPAHPSMTIGAPRKILALMLSSL
ncbi:MAG: squalene/phytoene synthase family protein [Sneathiellales bacterium]|nr:squalene/phytoene synthase family protein [Sneathiellales bacterium]